MRIAQIAPLVESVPPKKYGGTERVVHALTEELVRRGHEVTLFASGDSETSAELLSVVPKNLREARVKDLYGFNVWSLINLSKAYGSAERFDVIHDHSGYLGLPLAYVAHAPTIITMHGAFTDDVKYFFQILKAPRIACISHAQAATIDNINLLGVVHNGLPMLGYPFSVVPGKYLLYVGRICADKGTHLAVEVARTLQMPLIIAAKLRLADRPYFTHCILPYLSDTIRWIGEVDEFERNQLMRDAWCLLHPITWQEPFGLTLIEAMACGTPVIAFDKGSSREIIKHAKTGFVVESINDMAAAVKNIPSINRSDCREYVLSEFTVEKMTDAYEKMYRSVVGEVRRTST